MLFVLWDLKTTVYVILLTSCLGQELFRTCEHDYCLERSTKGQRFEREQSKRLSNERSQFDEMFNRVLEHHEVRLSNETSSDSRETARGVTEDLQHINGRVDAGRKILARQNSEKRLDNRDNENELNNNREKNHKALQRFTESTYERNSDRDYENIRRERRLVSRFEEGTHLGRRSLAHSIVTKQRCQDNNQKYEDRLNKRFDVHDRDYRNQREKNERLSISLNSEGNSNENIRRQIEYNELNRRSDRINNFIVRNTRAFGQVETSKERNDVIRIETDTFRRSFDDRRIRRDTSHRQEYLLSTRSSENQKPISSRRVEDTPENRCNTEFDATGLSVNRRQESDVRRQTDNRNGHQAISQPQNVNSRVQYENSEGRSNTGRLYVNQEEREQRSVRLEDDHGRHLRQINNREIDDPRERVENRLELRVDRELQSEVNGYLANSQQDIASRFETRFFYEREMGEISQDNKRSSLDTSERNKRAKSSRQYNERNEKDERKSVRRNERSENRNVERILNNQRNFRFSDKQILERNNAFIIEPRATTFRFIGESKNHEVGWLTKQTVLQLNGYTALGQALLFAYVVMITSNGKTDLRNQLQTKLREALEIVGF